MNINGIIFDYGGTIDTNSRHWADVLWSQYLAHQVPVTYEAFREAYVYAERYLATHYLVHPHHDFLDVLRFKIYHELAYLVLRHHLPADERVPYYNDSIAAACYQFVLRTLKLTRPVVEALSRKYPLVLVSNFYGNIQTILTDFNLARYFKNVIESSVVGIRKPDPAIFSLGVGALNLQASDVLVVGDSFSKDIAPAHSIGCHTAWLRGVGWGDETIDESKADIIIADLRDLPKRL